MWRMLGPQQFKRTNNVSKGTELKNRVKNPLTIITLAHNPKLLVQPGTYGARDPWPRCCFAQFGECEEHKAS